MMRVLQLRTSMPVSIRVVQTRTSSSPFSSFCQTGFSSSSVILPWAMPTRAPGAIRWTRAAVDSMLSTRLCR